MEYIDRKAHAKKQRREAERKDLGMTETKTLRVETMKDTEITVACSCSQPDITVTVGVRHDGDSFRTPNTVGDPQVKIACGRCGAAKLYFILATREDEEFDKKGHEPDQRPGPMEPAIDGGHGNKSDSYTREPPSSNVDMSKQ